MRRVTAAVQVWTEPVPMDTGSPDPTTLVDGCTLWVAYRAHDPAFPGWGRPETDEYLERHAGFEAFGVVRFDDVLHHQLEPSSEDRLRERPLWGKVLDHYSFHRIDGERPSWIVTFHDNTLYVIATAATASAMIFAADHLAAIEKVRKAV